LVFLQLQGRRLGLWIGLMGALCFATKASAVLFLLPIGFALICAFLLELRHRATTLWKALMRAGLPGIILGGLVGLFLYWLLVIRGFEQDWWFINFEHYGMDRATRGVSSLIAKMAKLPTHSDAVLLAVNGVVLLASIYSVKLAGELLESIRKEHDADPDPRKMIIRPEQFLVLVVLSALLLMPAMDISGRRSLFLVPLVVLLASSFFARKPQTEWGDFACKPLLFRLLCVLIVSQFLYVGLRTCYSMAVQGSLSLFSDSFWSKPVSGPMALRVELGVYAVFFIVFLILLVFRFSWLYRTGSARLSVACMCFLQVIYLGIFFAHGSY
jgi:hypothetical protein